jgi:hypothetical protein
MQFLEEVRKAGDVRLMLVIALYHNWRTKTHVVQEKIINL